MRWSVRPSGGWNHSCFRKTTTHRAHCRACSRTASLSAGGITSRRISGCRSGEMSYPVVCVSHVGKRGGASITVGPTMLSSRPTFAGTE
eukprot:260791-Rhodomonas_salina.1